MKTVIGLLSVIILVVFLGGCKGNGKTVTNGAPKKLVVVASLFPQYDFVRNIGGDRVDVTLLLPPGVEAHSFEPRPEDAVRITKADLFVFTNDYMEPWAHRFAGSTGDARVTMVNSSQNVQLRRLYPGSHADEDEHSHHKHGDRHDSGLDPHIWLDFGNASLMVDNITAAMSAKDPANAAFYANNATLFKQKLQRLDNDYKVGLSSCQKKVFLHGGHYTFGYLAHHYGLEYRSASALNSDAEPSPARMVELVKQVRVAGLKYIYTEELVSPRLAEMIARETGAAILTLHGAHNISRSDFDNGVTFMSLMEANLKNLKTGLQCR